MNPDSNPGANSRRIAAGLLPPDLPPQSPEAEMALIASLILDPPCIVQVIDILDSDAFYHAPHRMIFGALLAMHRSRRLSTARIAS